MVTSRTNKQRKPVIPLLKKGKLNIYSPEQIKAAGGMDSFLDIIANKEPISMPDFGFTENQWKEMEKYL
jgi:hypothetical protein